MLKPFRWLRARVTVRYWAWIHAFLALGIGWGHAIAIYPPTSYNGVVDLGLVFRMGTLTGVGSLIAVVGLLMTRSLRQQRAHRGLWLELVGVVLLGGGPLQYLALQIGFLVDDGFDARYALVWFAYAMCSFILVRFSIIIPALIESSRKARAQERSSR